VLSAGLFLIAFFGVAYTLIAACEAWWTKRQWRRRVAQAHEPRPFRKPLAAPDNPSNRSC
jgi:hypothetical protein